MLPLALCSELTYVVSASLDIAWSCCLELLPGSFISASDFFGFFECEVVCFGDTFLSHGVRINAEHERVCQIVRFGQLATVLNQQLSLCQEIIEGSSVLLYVSEIEVVKYVVGLGFHMLFASLPVFVEFLFFTAQAPSVEQV